MLFLLELHEEWTITVFIAHTISVRRVESFARYNSILFRKPSSVYDCGTDDEDGGVADAVPFLRVIFFRFGHLVFPPAA